MDRHGLKPKKDRADEVDRDLLSHINSLGLATIAEYLEWCVRNGFSRRTDKHWRVRLKERGHVNRIISDARLAQKKHEVRKPEKVIEKIFNGELNEDNVTQRPFQAVCRAYKSAHESRPTRLALQKLLTHVSACSDLVSGQSAIASLGCRAGNSFVDGL